MTSFVLILMMAQRPQFTTPVSSHTIAGFTSYSECSLAASKLKAEAEKSMFSVQDFFCVEVK